MSHLGRPKGDPKKDAPFKMDRVARRLQDAIEVSVSDSGIGVAPEQHAAIFEEFTQLGDARRPEGTGLGLALTKKLVELHGGSIRVESAPGQGATLAFTLPQPESATQPQPEQVQSG